jgi:hypothetical protein
MNCTAIRSWQCVPQRVSRCEAYFPVGQGRAENGGTLLSLGGLSTSQRPVHLDLHAENTGTVPSLEGLRFTQMPVEDGDGSYGIVLAVAGMP